MSRDLEQLSLSSAVPMGLTRAAWAVFSGRCLAGGPRYLYCLVMGGVECIVLPFGAVLGIFTIIVLVKESVQDLFAKEIVQNGTTG